MTIRKFVRQHTNDPDIQAIQTNIEQFSGGLSANIPIINGFIVTDVAITSGTAKTVDHALERPPNWIVIKKNANATVWDSQDTNANPKRTLILNSSANVTVDLWIF
jgi:hypothetical protein